MYMYICIYLNDNNYRCSVTLYLRRKRLNMRVTMRAMADKQLDMRNMRLFERLCFYTTMLF